MAANGRGQMRPHGASRSPPFLLIGLAVVICILGFNYWNASSKTSMLTHEVTELSERLRMISMKKLSVEKRNDAILQQLKDSESLLRKQTLLTSRKEKDCTITEQQLKGKTEDLETGRIEKKQCLMELEHCHENLTTTTDTMTHLKETCQKKEGDDKAKQDSDKCRDQVDQMRIKILQVIQHSFGNRGILILQQAHVDITGINMRSEGTNVQGQQQPGQAGGQGQGAQGPQTGQGAQGPQTGQGQGVQGPQTGQTQGVQGPQTGQGQGVQVPQPGQGQGVQAPQPGQGQNVQAPQQGTGQNVQGPQPGQGQGVQGPQPGQGQNVQGPQPGQGQNVQGPQPGQGQNVQGPQQGQEQKTGESKQGQEGQKSLGQQEQGKNQETATGTATAKPSQDKLDKDKDANKQQTTQDKDQQKDKSKESEKDEAARQQIQPPNVGQKAGGPEKIPDTLGKKPKVGEEVDMGKDKNEEKQTGQTDQWSKKLTSEAGSRKVEETSKEAGGGEAPRQAGSKNAGAESQPAGRIVGSPGMAGVDALKQVGATGRSVEQNEGQPDRQQIRGPAAKILEKQKASLDRDAGKGQDDPDKFGAPFAQKKASLDRKEQAHTDGTGPPSAQRSESTFGAALPKNRWAVGKVAPLGMAKGAVGIRKNLNGNDQEKDTLLKYKKGPKAVEMEDDTIDKMQQQKFRRDTQKDSEPGKRGNFGQEPPKRDQAEAPPGVNKFQ